MQKKLKEKEQTTKEQKKCHVPIYFAHLGDSYCVHLPYLICLKTGCLKLIFFLLLTFLIIFVSNFILCSINLVMIMMMIMIPGPPML